MDHRKIIGRNIQTLRKIAGFSQEELADLAGLHRTYVGSVERGERNISIDAIVQIANALKTAPKDLFENL